MTLRHRLRRLGSWHPQRRLALVLALVATWASVLLGDAVAGRVQVVGTVVVALATMVVLSAHENGGGPVLFAAVVAHWFLVGAPRSCVIPIALLALVAHVAQVTAVDGPAPAPYAPGALAAVARRTGIIAAVTVVVGGLALTVSPGHLPWMSYAAAAVLLFLAAGMVLVFRPPPR